MDVPVIEFNERIRQTRNVHLLIERRYDERYGTEELFVLSQPDFWASGVFIAGFFRPDIKCAAELSNQRELFENEGLRLDEGNQTACC